MSIVQFRRKPTARARGESLVLALAASLREAAQLERLVLASALPEAAKLSAMTEVMAASDALFRAHLVALRGMIGGEAAPTA